MCSSIQRFKEVIIRKSKWIFLESLKSRGVTKNQERDTQSPGHILLTCHQPDNKSLFRKWIKFSRLEDQVKKAVEFSEGTGSMCWGSWSSKLELNILGATFPVVQRKLYWHQTFSQLFSHNLEYFFLCWKFCKCDNLKFLCRTFLYFNTFVIKTCLYCVLLI